MLDTYIRFLLEILRDGILYFIAVGALFTCGIGLGMLVAPEPVLRLNRALGRWYSTRRSMKFLEIPRPQERLFYRHHTLFGILITAGALYSLYYILVVYNRSELVAPLSGGIEPSVVDWLLQAMAVFVLAGNVFVLGIGLIITLRPSMLKRFEDWCNLWISTRLAYKFLDVEHRKTDRLLTRHPRLVGGLVLLASLYVIANFSIAVILQLLRGQGITG